MPPRGRREKKGTRGEGEKEERSISARIPPEDLVGGDKVCCGEFVEGFNAHPAEDQGNCSPAIDPDDFERGLIRIFTLSRLEVNPSEPEALLCFLFAPPVRIFDFFFNQRPLFESRKNAKIFLRD